MDSANTDKTASAEKGLLNDTYPSSSSTYPTNKASQLSPRDNRRAMMSKVKHLCFLLFALSLLAITLVGANSSGSHVLSAEAQQFRELLDTLDATTLHEILHEHFKDKYQHGVYQEDKSALEAIHKQNAAVAQSLVQLVRRQGPETTNNTGVVTTTATTETTISITTTVTSTSTPPPPVEPTPTPTPSVTPPVEPTPTPTPTPTPSVSTPPVSTTTSTLPPSSTSIQSSSSTSVPTTLSSTTSARSTTTSASSSASSRITAGPDEVATNIVYETTLADGATVLTTQYTVVPADQTAQPTGSGAGTNTAKASLQTGLANSQYHLEGWTAGVGVLGLAVAWGL